MQPPARWPVAIRCEIMSEFYEIDSTHVSVREYWWGNKSPLVIIAWILKVLRVRIPSSSDDPNTDSTAPFIIETLPPDVMKRFESLTSDITTLGFQNPIFHQIHDPGSRTTVFWATFRHESGKHFARIHNRVWHQTQKADRGLFPMFFTEFTEGTFLVSSAGKPDFAAPDSVQMNRRRGAKALDLWQSHERLVRGLSGRKMIAPVLTSEDLAAASERHHVLTRDFHLARGVFRKRTPEEQSKAAAFTGRIDEARASGQENAEVLAELERLQEKKAGWKSILWVLAGSLVAFVALGAAKWNWNFTLWILPVLFLHEAGHWVAMRIFHYRNLRMFFIPLFGAAVMGQNWNVPGWKKALVSLAGPVPGIALGVVMATAGLILHKAWLSSAALVLLLVNGLNLLPMLPLDGGHVLQATLFCRNRWLDGAFRIIAILGLIAFGIFGGGKLLAYVAIPMAIALPVVFKLAKVTDGLRHSPLPPPAPGEDRIPGPTAQAIITAIRAAFPPKVTLGNKTLAQHTLSVFETLNARPPGWLVTIVLLAVHGGAFLASAILALLLIMDKHGGGLGGFMQAAVRQPQHSIECGNVATWTGSETDARAHNILISTLKNRAVAGNVFAELTNTTPAKASLMLFGDSLLLSLPAQDDAAREHWFEVLQSRSTNTFVVLSNSSATVTMTFVAQTAKAATNLVQELQEYFENTTAMNLIPPWSPEARTAQYARFRRNRESWRQINREVMQVWRDPSLKSYPNRISAALRRGSLAEMNRLQIEHEKRILELRTQAVEKLRRDSRLDVGLLDLQGRLHSLAPTNRLARKAVYREIAGKLGEVSYDGDQPASGADSYGVTMGMVAQHGLLIEIPWVSFLDVTQGLPALTQWLCASGCRQVRYDFGGNTINDRLEEEAE